MRPRLTTIAAAAAIAAVIALIAPGAGAGAAGESPRPPADNYIPWPSVLPGREVGPAGPPQG